MTSAEPPAHPDVHRGVELLRAALASSDLAAFPVTDADDPKAGILYINADPLNDAEQYRAVPLGALPTVEQARDGLLATLATHGRTQDLGPF